MYELLLFLASALLGSGILFHHKRVLSYIGLAGALFELELLFTTFLHRTVGASIPGPTFFLITGILFLALGLAYYRSWKSPYSTAGSGVRDFYVGIAMLLILACAYPVVSSNGYVGDEFVLHGFYNGDVATFASLVQKSFTTSVLVHENPFSANGFLEYPTLLHATVSDLFSLVGIGKDWLPYLSLMIYAQIVITIPLFFLLWDVIYPEPDNAAEKWFGISSRRKVYAIQLLLTLAAIFLSIDSFIYPQSHFFLIASFVATLALLTKTASLQGGEQVSFGILSLISSYILLQTNTVIGTIAVILAGTLCLLRIFDKKRSVAERALFLVLGFALVGVLHTASDGRTAFNNPHFSVSAASEMIRSGLPAILVLGASVYSLSRKQYIATAASIVSLLGFVVFLLSDRNIVTENASRFLYHGFSIGFFLLLPLTIQLLYYLRRELLLTSRPLSELIAGWIAVIVSFLILMLPIGISGGNTYRSLLTSDEHRISVNTKIALWWIADHAPVDSVIITNPHEPFLVPFFTGRAMLRATDYWLSQQDDTLKDLEDAYEGDTNAQENILRLGSFLFVTKEEAPMWDTSRLKKVVDTGDAIVYSTR